MGSLKGKARLRILVIKPSSFGDIVHLFPALAMMRDKFPEAELDFVVNPEFVPLLGYSPFPVSRKIIFERRKIAGVRFLPELLALRRELRREKYDVVIDFQGLFRSGYITSLCRAKIKAGFAGARERSAEIFYNRRIAVSGSHAVERYAALVSKLFEISENVYQPVLPVDEKAAASLPELPSRYMVLLPGHAGKANVSRLNFSVICAAVSEKKFRKCSLLPPGVPGKGNMPEPSETAY